METLCITIEKLEANLRRGPGPGRVAAELVGHHTKQVPELLIAPLGAAGALQRASSPPRYTAG